MTMSGGLKGGAYYPYASFNSLMRSLTVMFCLPEFLLHAEINL